MLGLNSQISLSQKPVTANKADTQSSFGFTCWQWNSVLESSVATRPSKQQLQTWLPSFASIYWQFTVTHSSVNHMTALRQACVSSSVCVYASLCVCVLDTSWHHIWHGSLSNFSGALCRMHLSMTFQVTPFRHDLLTPQHVKKQK